MTTPRNRSILRFLALALLLFAALPVSRATAYPEDAGNASEPLLVYDESLRQLTLLQPDTLAPLEDAAIPFGDRVSSWSFARSADGSTLVNLDPAEPRAFIVRDGHTGAERYRVATELTISNPVLSADGSRLLVNRETVGPLSWALFDTTTGRLIFTYDCPEGWAEPVTASPDLSRLYYLTIPSNNPLPEGDKADHPELVAVDLSTGETIGRTLLLEIASGVVPPDDPADDEALYHMNVPGIAISPDGNTIAVVRADRAAFTLIDAGTLTIERTEAITRPKSSLHHFLTWLSILPQSAEAKMGTADFISASFSPDTTRLYVWGFHNAPEIDQHREVSTGIGLLAVDVATGEIRAEGPHDQLIRGLVASPDGRSLYITGPTSGKALYSWVADSDIAEFRSPVFLQRLDSSSLELQAAREYSDPIWLSPPATED